MPDDQSLAGSRAGLDDLTRAFELARAKLDHDPAQAPLGLQPEHFLAAVAEDYRPDELASVSLKDLAAALARFWSFGAAFEGGDPAMRLERARGLDGEPLAYDVLEIVQADAPFIVDSVMAEVAEQGVDIRGMFHPLAGHGDERRSMIQVWLEPISPRRRERLLEGMRVTLADVHQAVDDFPAMLGLMARSIGELMRAAPGDPAILAEDIAFLRWLDDGHFVFLGARNYDYPRTPDGGYAAEEPTYDPDGGLGVLRDATRVVLRRDAEPAVLSVEQRDALATAGPLVVAKSNQRSRVHRRTFLDYIGVRRYGSDGRPSGEVRFVGLFTAEAYDGAARDTPVLRQRISETIAAAGFPAGSHNATRLTHILETFPRDELFQVTPAELLPIARDILHLSDRPRIRLFVRNDPFDRFISILLYAPRERFDERLRKRAAAILEAAWQGELTSATPSYGDAPLARVHFMLRVTPGAHPEPDLQELEAAVAQAARTWHDELETEVRGYIEDGPQAGRLLQTWGAAFPIGYQDRYAASEGLTDLLAADALSGAKGSVSVRAFREPGEGARHFRFKLYRRGNEPARLANVLPILADMGLSALSEEGFEVTPGDDSSPVWIHEFVVEDEDGEHLSFADVRAPFEDAFPAVWSGETESDGFNRLVLALAISWREAALVRALARYRQQSGLDPSQPVQEAALACYPDVALLILKLFAVRFDPASHASIEERQATAAALAGEIEAALQAVESLDDDRALRRIAGLVGALTRTNFYQTDPHGRPKPYISFKIASREIAELPAPKPFREIFVASPVVEGVHLRMGPIARGGLRWSDRRDDFRTEVLGLVKAQQVKNAVIVPVGSKGGFFPKRLPRGGSAQAIREEAIVAYKVFLCGLLDITDTIDANGKVAHPKDVILHDGDDPYLVVAADKGTASFSDIANGVAQDYGFWLGDAFASGGSAGFDHKAMAITARGAWESVKRHFRELGKDIQTQPTSVIGVGDMSGDVFGNGMLLSKSLQLIAAFDHRHIFIDPAPDPKASWAERQRLYDLPASSWDSYDRALISEGGGVWPRTLKSVPVSPQMAALLDLKVDALSPGELITAILKARAELLYLGGIGTYVKASWQSNLEVGDKANDAIRVNGRELRCKVVGEGANLGFTQAGRIEFALGGGRIDTDAIDNSAGVDTSDHEVNIKILTGMAERAGDLAPADRDPLLAAMTDDVASHVLAHNYDQTLALTLLESEGADEAERQGAFIRELESAGRLDRGLEGLPADAEIAERVRAGRGLTRPEISVLLAYGKLELFEEIVTSDAPDDPWFLSTLERYFPASLHGFGAEMRAHRLRREIISTVLDNDIVNLCGPTFASRLRAAAGCDTTALVAAFAAARETLRFAGPWGEVAALDGKIPAAAQTPLFRELVYVLRGQTYWLARRAAREGAQVQGLIDSYRPTVDALKAISPQCLSSFEAKAAVRRAQAWIKAGAPRNLAHSIALMRTLAPAATITELAAQAGWPIGNAAFVYHRVGGVFGFDKLRAAAGSRATADTFERLAVRRLVEDMHGEQAALALAIMRFAGASHADPAKDMAAVAAWSGDHSVPVKAARRTVEEIEAAAGPWTFAKLTIANAALRELAGA
ncbi:MAG TPA: NAD-glutamate dehydrogenase [Caulobacteraceae bacterium]|jgi:glutamate dehydrogenase|nr:NAD-glutamate dehydrogenase [Caulobacteraceae bacterium]